MLLVECELKPVDGKLELYSKSFIPKGTIIWQYSNLSCHVYWRRQFLNYCFDLLLAGIREFLNRSYIKNGVIYSPTDFTKYISHSFEPNTAMKDENSSIAIKDISENERFTENFGISYDEDDFYFWNEINEALDKDTLLRTMRDRLFSGGRPKSSFEYG